jgi:hypothetical protein
MALTTGGAGSRSRSGYDRASRKIKFNNVDQAFGPKGLIGSFIPGSAAEKRAQELLERHGNCQPLHDVQPTGPTAAS